MKVALVTAVCFEPESSNTPRLHRQVFAFAFTDEGVIHWYRPQSVSSCELTINIVFSPAKFKLDGHRQSEQHNLWHSTPPASTMVASIIHKI